MLVARYMAKEALKTVAIVLVVVVLLLSMNQFVRYVNLAASGSIPFSVVFKILGCEIPTLVGYVLPMAFYLGLLVTLARFYQDSEMTVLHACGYGVSRVGRNIAWMALCAAACTALAVAWLQPTLGWERKALLAQAQAAFSLNKIMPGRFQSLPNQSGVIYAQSADAAHHLRQVFFTVLAPQKHAGMQWDTIVAASASRVRKHGYPYVLFKDGTRYIGTPGDLAYRIMTFKQYGMALEAPVLNMRDKVKYWSMQQVWRKRNTSLAAYAAWHWRLALPLSCIVLALWAFFLAEVRVREGKYARMIPAVLVYLIYMQGLFSGRVWLERGITPPVLGLWWVHVVMLVLLCAAWLYRRSGVRLFKLGGSE